MAPVRVLGARIPPPHRTPTDSCAQACYALGTMRRQITKLLVVAAGLATLSGCLFSVNEPLVTPGGAIALFLNESGGYSLFPESATLHLRREGSWMPIPSATISDGGGPLGLSPDGRELLYVDVESVDIFSPFTSTIRRVGVQTDSLPTAILETQEAVARAVWTERLGILVQLFGQGDFATLHAFDPDTGEIERLADNLLSFAYLRETDEIILLQAIDEAGVPLAEIVRWDTTTDARTSLAAFVLNEATWETFATLPHRFFWAVSPKGQWLALSVFDATFLVPEGQSDIPSLYLIDLAGDETRRLSAQALMPAFSPDGQGLLYVQAADGDRGDLMYLCLQADCRPVAVPGGEGVSAAFWLSPTTIAAAFETENDLHRLVELDLENGRQQVLVDGLSDSSD